MPGETPPVGAAPINLRMMGVSLGGSPVLRDVDLEVGEGAVVGVSGPNGSGKTTLIRLTATLIKPDRGEGTVLGASLGTFDVTSVRRQIGMITHTPTVIPELTLSENLEHAARLIGIDPGRVEGALRVVGLEDAAERTAGAASFGMQRRAEVARLLMTRPSVLLLDEATSGLDPDAKSLIQALIDRAVKDQGTVIMVSHDSKHLDERCDRVFRIEGGRLIPG